MSSWVLPRAGSGSWKDPMGPLHQQEPSAEPGQRDVQLQPRLEAGPWGGVYLPEMSPSYSSSLPSCAAPGSGASPSWDGPSTGSHCFQHLFLTERLLPGTWLHLSRLSLSSLSKSQRQRLYRAVCPQIRELTGAVPHLD